MLPSFTRMRRLPYLPPRSSAGVATAAASPTAMMVVPVDGRRQRHLQQRQQRRAITSQYNSGQSLTCPLHPVHWKGHNYKPLLIKKRGVDIVQDPLYNKGTGFEHGERDRLNIRGLLPPRYLDFKTQIDRVMSNLRNQGDDMRKHIYLSELHDRNETLFHRVLVDNIEELAPIIYTPTVGRACLEFAQHFRRPRGMYFSTMDRGHFASMMYNWPQRDVHVIVVTDGSRILGLGDLGANGAGIPIGKLALYCAAGGIAPHRVLPVVLDCGTNNEKLLNDPFYLGMQHPRLRGPEFFQMVDEFMDAVRNRFPRALIQYEDFSSDVAYDILSAYRRSSLVFNDDIQGTGTVTLGGILSALRNQGKNYQDLKAERFLIAGAGSAGCGVAATLLQGMVEQGMNYEMAKKQFYMCDKDGLLGLARKDTLTPQQLEFMRDDLPDGLSLLDVAKHVKPTVLLGLSAQRGLFKEELVKEVAKHAARPFIFPLSNPTTSAECTAAEAYLWTHGRAIFASGSPFEPVTIHGKTYKPSQANNFFVFPGIGLGAVVSGATIITDKMLYAASEAVAASLTEEERAEGRVFPRVARIRQVSLKVATEVAKAAVMEKLARNVGVADLPYLEGIIQRKMYDPTYVPLVAPN
ncbi:nad-dependent malic enzyme [Nannochloropsis oceanica]